MMALEYKRIVTNILARDIVVYHPAPEVAKHWHWMGSVRQLERYAPHLPSSVLFWQVKPNSPSLEARALHTLKDLTLSFIVMPGYPMGPASRLAHELDPHYIWDRDGYRDALRRASLALRPFAWKMPLQARLEGSGETMEVEFANGDKVRMDIHKYKDRGLDFSRAYIDHEKDSFAVLIPREKGGEPAALGWDVIRRETGTLPSKSVYNHQLSQEDLDQRAAEHGSFIRRKYEARHMKQDEFARKAGISREQLSRIVNGKHYPQLSTLRKMAKALGENVESLLPVRPDRG